MLWLVSRRLACSLLLASTAIRQLRRQTTGILAIRASSERVQELPAKITTRPGYGGSQAPHLCSSWSGRLSPEKVSTGTALCLQVNTARGVPHSPNVFSPHTSSSGRHMNSRLLFLPRVRTDYYRGSVVFSYETTRQKILWK